MNDDKDNIIQFPTNKIVRHNNSPLTEHQKVQNKLNEQLKKVQTKQTTEQMANEWIDILKNAAKDSKTLGQFENNLIPLRKEFLSELQTIWEDLIQQQRIEDSYISLQKQINNRKQ